MKSIAFDSPLDSVKSTTMDTEPHWFKDHDMPSYPPLREDLSVDALVIGGGITGVSTAYLLAAEGLTVALVERDKIGGGDTGHTTAHLTYMTDTRLSDLVSSTSQTEARIAWEAGRAAMEWIEKVVNEQSLECELVRVPGFFVAAIDSSREEEIPLLKKEVQLARDWGFDVTFIESAPVTHRPGILFPDQMKFHPLRYLHGLLKAAGERGVRAFERTEVFEFHKGQVTANGHRIRFKDVFIATHVPLQGNSGTMGSALFQTKLALYSTYALGAQIPSGLIEEMIWSDTADPFNYLRIDQQEGASYVILGGEDHKTGQSEDTEEPFRELEKKLFQIFPDAKVTDRWSGQVVETPDGLPFIGRSEENQFIATGFSGNGMTFGTVAALMARDAIRGDKNSWTETFDPSRKVGSSLGVYLSENADFPVHMVKDRLNVPEKDPSTLSNGCGEVIQQDGKRIAACRDSQGVLHLRSAVCPHLGCIVAWNEAEQTWDCPCHGSRFRSTGEVIAGPAETDLAQL